MPQLYIQETFINQTKGYRLGDGDVQPAYQSTIGELFRSLQREYGRCVSRAYIDRAKGSHQAIGWVFEKRMRYEDARANRPEDHYIREVWVTVHTAPPKKTIRYQYAELGGKPSPIYRYSAPSLDT